MNYPMQVVVRETGLTAHVLRVWERRYGAVVPQRTASGRRVYGEADLKRLKLLRQLTLRGHPIGTVANLSEKELTTLVNAQPDRSAALEQPPQDPPIIRDCIEAVKNFDLGTINSLLERAAVVSGYNALLRHVIAPLAHRLGMLWEEGVLTMSHEHFATAAIRAFLLNPARQYAGENSHATLVASTPQGQLHELGAVMSAALANEQGWRAIYLGPSLPAAEIAGAALQNKARAVALSIIYPADDPNVERELYDLRRFLPDDVAILAGGRAAEHYRDAIEANGGILVSDLARLQVELAKIRTTRRKTR
jgi:DNA-binding transcriptional MerR regulator/methylmalonyl-CoA mutase cobalamin-binding subunit